MLVICSGRSRNYCNNHFCSSKSNCARPQAPWFAKKGEQRQKKVPYCATDERVNRWISRRWLYTNQRHAAFAKLHRPAHGRIVYIYTSVRVEKIHSKTRGSPPWMKLWSGQIVRVMAAGRAVGGEDHDSASSDWNPSHRGTRWYINAETRWRRAWKCKIIY